MNTGWFGGKDGSDSSPPSDEKEPSSSDHASCLYDVCAVYSSRDYDMLRVFIIGLQHLVRLSWTDKPGLRVFRLCHKTNPPDDPSTSWATFCHGAEHSQKLLLMASPESAASPHVAREIQQWRTMNPTDHTVIAKIRGTCGWSPEIGGFDPNNSSAVNPATEGQFTEPPPIVDLTWTPEEEDVKLPVELYRAALIDLTTAILDCRRGDVAVDLPLPAKKRLRYFLET